MDLKQEDDATPAPSDDNTPDIHDAAYPLSDDIEIQDDARFFISVTQELLQRGEEDSSQDRSGIDDFFRYIENDVISRKKTNLMLGEIEKLLSDEIASDLRECLQLSIQDDEECIKCIQYLSDKYGDHKNTKKCLDEFIDFMNTDDAIFPIRAMGDTVIMMSDDKLSGEDHDLMGECHRYMFSLIF